ncbi:hypothetical protein, partial [Clostridium perfringens]|uniref:hypothetical protein n=1 Tax=Clostridium perfringens TaxID=1502 RepID=UPI002ACC2F57
CTTETEWLDMISFGDNCTRAVNENNGNMPNDLNGYTNLMGDMKVYIQRYNNIDNRIYESFMNIANNLQTELKKYK